MDVLGAGRLERGRSRMARRRQWLYGVGLLCVFCTAAGCSSGHELPGTLEETLLDAGLRIDPVGDDLRAAADGGDPSGDGDGDGEGRAGTASASAGTAGASGSAGNGAAGNGRGGQGGSGGTSGAAGNGFGSGCGRCGSISSMLGDVQSCCHASGECGIDLSALGTPQCVEQNAPGSESASCPELDVAGLFQIPGCCTPAGECGLLIRQLLPLGCTTAQISLAFAGVMTPGSSGRCR
jgi:hypothetical protein